MSTENRSAPRVEILAQVQVSNDSEVYIMSTTNISLSGIFIQGNPSEYPEIQNDIILDLVIFATDDGDACDVHLAAKVVRIAEDLPEEFHRGFGLQFTAVTDQQTQALEKLIQAVVD